MSLEKSYVVVTVGKNGAEQREYGFKTFKEAAAREKKLISYGNVRKSWIKQY